MARRERERERERERKRVPQFVYRGRSNIVRRECKYQKLRGRSWNLLLDAITTLLSAQRSGQWTPCHAFDRGDINIYCTYGFVAKA